MKKVAVKAGYRKKRAKGQQSEQSPVLSTLIAIWFSSSPLWSREYRHRVETENVDRCMFVCWLFVLVCDQEVEMKYTPHQKVPFMGNCGPCASFFPICSVRRGAKKHHHHESFMAHLGSYSPIILYSPS
jgi:hypothetical protein